MVPASRVNRITWLWHLRPVQSFGLFRGGRQGAFRSDKRQHADALLLQSHSHSRGGCLGGDTPPDLAVIPQPNGGWPVEDHRPAFSVIVEILAPTFACRVLEYQTTAKHRCCTCTFSPNL